MMNFFKKIHVGNIRTILQEVIARFPLATFLSVVVSATLVYLVARENTIDKHTQTVLLNTVVTCAVSFFLSVSLSLFGESEKCTGARRFVPQLVVIIFGAFFYSTLDGYTFESFEAGVFILLTLAGFLSLLFVAPFVRRILTRKYDQDVYYGYFYRTSLVFLFSMIA